MTILEEIAQLSLWVSTVNDISYTWNYSKHLIAINWIIFAPKGWRSRHFSNSVFSERQTLTGIYPIKPSYWVILSQDYQTLSKFFPIRDPSPFFFSFSPPHPTFTHTVAQLRFSLQEHLQTPWTLLHALEFSEPTTFQECQVAQLWLVYVSYPIRCFMV